MHLSLSTPSAAVIQARIGASTPKRPLHMIRYLAIVRSVSHRENGLVVPRVLRYLQPRPLSAALPAVEPETDGVVMLGVRLLGCDPAMTSLSKMLVCLLGS